MSYGNDWDEPWSHAAAGASEAATEERDFWDDHVSVIAVSIPFADPGGNSALRASSRRNPRNLPCPTCKAPDRLTPADVARGYQCDGCADAAEGGF